MMVRDLIIDIVGSFLRLGACLQRLLPSLQFVVDALFWGMPPPAGGQLLPPRVQRGGRLRLFLGDLLLPLAVRRCGIKPLARTSQARFNATLCNVASTACCRHHCLPHSVRWMFCGTCFFFFFPLWALRAAPTGVGLFLSRRYIYRMLCMYRVALQYRVVLASLSFGVVHCLLRPATPNINTANKSGNPPTPPPHSIFSVSRLAGVGSSCAELSTRGAVALSLSLSTLVLVLLIFACGRSRCVSRRGAQTGCVEFHSASK